MKKVRLSALKVHVLIAPDIDGLEKW